MGNGCALRPGSIVFGRRLGIAPQPAARPGPEAVVSRTRAPRVR